MGGDGGTYATSRKYVRGAKLEEKDEAKNIKQQQILRTKQCALSGEVRINKPSHLTIFNLFFSMS